MKSLKDLYSLIATLKTTKRQGWLLKGMDSDVIASHAYGAMCIGFFLAKEQGVDANKVVQMLLVHDWVMAKMQDVTPPSGKYSQKRDMEQVAKRVIYSLTPKVIQEDYLILFDEFNTQKTQESQVAKEADKIETLLQGEAYEESTGNSEVLDGFFEGYEEVFKTKLGKQIFQDLKKRDLKRKC